VTEVNRSGTPVVIVAIIGLLSTVVASALGGFWANKSADTAAASVQQQFESERTAAVQDLRRDVYIGYLRETSEGCLAYKANDDARFDSTALEVYNQAALVLFLADRTNRQFQDVVSEFTSAIVDGSACADNDSYFGQANAFVETAQKELE